MKADATLLERLEQARALRTRVGSDALLTFLDTFEPEDVTDWHRIALSEFAGWFNVESGHRFTEEVIEKELAEADQVWSRLHPGSIDRAALIAALNDRPGASPVDRREPAVAAVLDWGTWAAFHQRQLSLALTARNHHFWNLGDKDSQQSMVGQFRARFGGLTLFPVVLRSIATTSSDYELSVAGGRTLVAASPELVTAAEWNLFAEKPKFVPRAAAFPFIATWFTPAVPTGTAFDLHARALLPGCPRPPTQAQVKLWAQAVPYDHWTVWSAVYLNWPGSGKPTAPAIFRAFGAMMDYDYVAALKVLDYTPMTTNERIEVAQKICGISTARCNRVALLLLEDAREPEAVAAYERWIASSRDRVGVSTGLTWLVRHYYATGKRERAEELARMAADVASYGRPRNAGAFAGCFGPLRGGRSPVSGNRASLPRHGAARDFSRSRGAADRRQETGVGRVGESARDISHRHAATRDARARRPACRRRRVDQLRTTSERAQARTNGHHRRPRRLAGPHPRAIQGRDTPAS